MSYLDSPNPESPSRFLDFQTPDVKCFEGLLQSPPSPSYFLTDNQETDISFRNLLVPKQNSYDSLTLSKDQGNVTEFKVSFDFSGEDLLQSFERSDQTQKNTDAFTFFEDSDKDDKRNDCNYYEFIDLSNLRLLKLGPKSARRELLDRRSL